MSRIQSFSLIKMLEYGTAIFKSTFKTKSYHDAYPAFRAVIVAKLHVCADTYAHSYPDFCFAEEKAT